jgi:hypothetical protein
MKRLLIAVAVTAAAMQVSVATAATYFFSFTSTSPNVPGTVTGEIFGLQPNQSGQAATDVEILSFPSGLGLSLATPIDVFTTATVGNNSFQTSGNVIVSAMFSATSSQYNLNIFNGVNLSLLQNPNGPLNARGTASFSLVPLPAALPLFATGIGGLGLLGWRRRRKARTA